MGFQIVDTPQFTNHWDDLYDAICENKSKAVVVPVPSDKSGSAYRQNIVQAMKGRKLSINTLNQGDTVVVWFRGHIAETISPEVA